MNEITVKAPATTSNLGAGFDICGMALEEPFDFTTVRKIEKAKSKKSAAKSAENAEKTVIRNVGRYKAHEDAKESVIAAVIKKMREDFRFKDGFEIIVEKNIRIKGGLGSSAAEATAVAYALDKLYGLRLTREQLVYYASFGEGFAAGSRHLDNVSSCVFGGFNITYSHDPIKVKRINPPKDLECLLVMPAKEKESTKFARSVLPETVPRKDALYNCFCLSKLIIGFVDGNVDLITRSLDDRIVEPARAKAGILPNLLELREIGKKCGYGVAASGAGPTMIALGSKKNADKKEFERKVGELFAGTGMAAELLWTKPSSEGAKAQKK